LRAKRESIIDFILPEYISQKRDDKDMKTGKFLITGMAAGAVIWVIFFIVNTVVNIALPYNIFELGGMRAANDPVMLLFFLHPFVLGLALAYVYPYIGKSLEGDSLRKGTKFGLMMWVVVSVPSIFLVYASMNYPNGFTVNSIAGSFLYMLAAGIVIAKISKIDKT